MSTSRKAIQLAAVATIAFAGYAPLVQAAPVTWDSGGANTNWGTDLNWDTDLAPGTSDVAVFGSIASAPTRVPNTNVSVAVGGITIDNSGGYVWQIPSGASSVLTVGASGLTASGGGTTAIGAKYLSFSADQTWDIGASTEVTVKALQGTGKLTKTGSGTLRVATSDSASLTGSIDVVSGVLANASGSGIAGASVVTTIFDGATYHALQGTTAKLVLKDNSTVRGSSASDSGVRSNTNSQILLDSAAGTDVTFETLDSSHVLVLVAGVRGGASDSVVKISGPGVTKLRTSTSSGQFLGSWKVSSGATLSIENYEVGSSGAIGYNGTSARPIELAGGTLRAGITTLNGVGGNINIGVGNSNNAAYRSAISVTDDSTVIVEQYSGSASIAATSVQRNAGVLTMNGSQLTVTSGRMGETGSPVVPFIARLRTDAVNLTATSIFNLVNGPDLLGQPVNAELDVDAVGGAFGLIKTGNGLLNLRSALNTYAGATTVSGGTLQFATHGAQSTSAISVASGAKVIVGNTSATSTKADLSGSGLIEMLGSTSNDLSLQGSAISPGNSAGILTINGAPVTLALDGAQLASLNIEVVGGGAVAGVDHDQLVIGSALTGLANADLFVNLSGVTNGDLAGDVLTIVTSTSDFTGLSFASVNFTSGWSGDVNYNNGSITLSNLQEVPEPATLGLVASMGMLLLGRRRRND